MNILKRHWAFKDITGRTFGRLTVIESLPVGYGNTTRAMWKCQCSCGNTRNVSGNDLRMGQSTSCGCLRSEKTSKAKRKLPYQWIYNGLKRRSELSGKSCEITYNDFLSYTTITHCHYCGTKIVWHEHKTNGQSSAYFLDRKNNILGYTKDNCVVCCATCNWVKSDVFSYEEMIELGKTIAKINEKRYSYGN